MYLKMSHLTWMSGIQQVEPKKHSALNLRFQSQRGCLPAPCLPAPCCDAESRWERAQANLKYRGPSLGIFRHDCWLRVVLARVVLHPAFEWVILILISVDLVLLVFQNHPPKYDSPHDAWLQWASYFFVGVYTVEIAMRVIVMGLYNGSQTFLQQECALLDCLALAASLLNLVFPMVSGFRGLRAIRIAARSAAIRIIIYTLYWSLPAISHLVILYAFIWTVWGVFGVQCFQGYLYSCNDAAVFSKEECVGLYTPEAIPCAFCAPLVGVLEPRRWQRKRYGFDNLGNSMFTLWELAIGERWTTIMFDTVDSTSPTTGFRQNYAPERTLFFVGFMIIGNFLAVNMFVGYIAHRFYMLKYTLDGTVVLTQAQRDWVHIISLLNRGSLLPEPNPDKGRFRRGCLALCSSMPWKAFMALAIVASLGTLCTVGMEPADFYQELQHNSSLVMAVLFLFDTALSVVGLGWRHYWASNLNRCDLLITLVACLTLMEHQYPLFEVFRGLKGFRLLWQIPKRRRLLETLILAVPSLLRCAPPVVGPSTLVLSPSRD